MPTKAEIQAVRALRERKHRAAQGRFVVEGEKVVRELLAAHFAFERVYATEAFGADGVRVTEDEMAKMSHFPTPSPVLAIGRIEERPLAAGEVNRGLTLALDGVQDPGNVGTLLRIADWFGLARVLLSPDSADLFSQKTINASMGSFARMPAYRLPLTEALAKATVPVIGCDLTGEDIGDAAAVSDAVIVIGSEGRGLSPEVRARLTRTLTIPRYGRAESLNAAVAAGIVLQHLRKGSRVDS